MLRDRSDQSPDQQDLTREEHEVPCREAPSREARTTGKGRKSERRRRAVVFVQEPFVEPRTTALRVGVICDGTSRGGPNGIAEGAARVVECAEHCADRGDVDVFAAFILSPQNLVRRAAPFFAGLHAEMLRLVDAVVEGRALRGVRVEVAGRLDRLRARGGAAARLSHAVEMLVEVTRDIPSPRARLALGVDYAEDAPLALGLDLLVRTGMEEDNVLRLSGLRCGDNTLCIPSTTLWRCFTPADLDEVLALAVAHARPEPARGFSGAFVAELAACLSREEMESPLTVLLPAEAPARAIVESIDRAGGVGRGVAVGVVGRAGKGESLSGASRTACLDGAAGGPKPRRAPRAPVEILFFDGRKEGWSPELEPVAWLVPGQSPRVVRRLTRSVRDANIHGCEPTPAGVARGIREALRFRAAHPQLHGAPRPAAKPAASFDERVEGLIREVGSRPDRSVEALAREIAAGGDGRWNAASHGLGETALLGDVFAARCMFELRSSGLVSGEIDWSRQAFGYALTAFAIAHGRADGEDWEPAAMELARAMLVMAASDEEISDRVFEGESPGAVRERLAVSVEYLTGVLRGGAPRVPGVRGAGVLGAIARGWTGIFERLAKTAHPALLAGARAAAESLYRANLEEISQVDPMFSRLLRARAEGRRDIESVRELRLRCRLARTAPSIGAGCAFLVMACTEPRAGVPDEGPPALLRTTPLIDHAFRLANDLAFTDAARGDRDDKPNAFTCLVPRSLSGRAREEACAGALRTCRGTLARLWEEIQAASADLAAVWPLAASWVARGVHVGRRAYQNTHYSELAPQAMGAIVSEVASL